ncbi:LysM peptidoglycan-binding domain-containing protein [Anaerobacillus sp. HL2]|nr:LysM peptidoglycan-binding domain-containing protein [Anaerobacillus sp. HL2]
MVVSGDTLWRISLTYGVSIEDLKLLNNLTSDMIYVGQVLLIFAGDEKEDLIVEKIL